MARYEYYVDRKLHTLMVDSVETLSNRASKPTRKGGLSKRAVSSTAPEAAKAVQSQRSRLGSLFNQLEETTVSIGATSPTSQNVVVTETVTLDGAKTSEINWLKKHFGLELIKEGQLSKVLLRVPESGPAGVTIAFEAAKAVFERGKVTAAHPNFLRLLPHIGPSVAGNQSFWNHDNSGNPGMPGADVAALAAWTITNGNPEIRVAVLDEGVDTAHPALKSSVVAERDFVDNNSHARPDANDAHGTACAGIIFSRNAKYPGLASGCSLVAIRIAKGDGNDGWVFDDFDTADAIDWAWRDAKADVLSNSWGGGPPVDVITRAIGRARTKGRAGKGAVVVFAAGNENGPVSYPGNLPDVLTVGASNPWDVRKTPATQDGENFWGSNFGRPLDLLAPGVKIATSDIHGAAGYGLGDFIETFNGTSSATPHVAAAAALILSVAPHLTESRITEVINNTADRLLPTAKWNPQVGHGRLNIYNALRLARR